MEYSEHESIGRQPYQSKEKKLEKGEAFFELLDSDASLKIKDYTMRFWNADTTNNVYDEYVQSSYIEYGVKHGWKNSKALIRQRGKRAN